MASYRAMTKIDKYGNLDGTSTKSQYLFTLTIKYCLRLSQTYDT